MFTAELKAAREAVREERFMKTVLERATVGGKGLVVAAEKREQWECLTELAQEGHVFQAAFCGDGAVGWEHAAQHQDIHFAVLSISILFLTNLSLLLNSSSRIIFKKVQTHV